MPWHHPFYSRLSSGRAPSLAQFKKLNQEILDIGADFLEALVPDGQVMGNDFVTLNPHRPDRNLGSFRLCLRGPRAGAWADFALPADTDARGGDVISWWAYIRGVSQGAALRDLKKALARMLDDDAPGRSQP